MKKILFSLIVLISLAAQGQEKNHYGIYRIDSLHETLGSTTDTTTYKPVGVSSTGRKRRLSYWPGSGGSTPTLQQVLTAGSTLTTTNTIQNGNNTFSIHSDDGATWESLAQLTPTSIRLKKIPYVAGASSYVNILDSLYLNSQNTSGPESWITIDPNYIALRPYNGDLRAVIGSGVGTKAVRYNPSTQKFTYADTTTGTTVTGGTGINVSSNVVSIKGWDAWDIATVQTTNTTVTTAATIACPVDATGTLVVEMIGTKEDNTKSISGRKTIHWHATLNIVTIDEIIDDNADYLRGFTNADWTVDASGGSLRIRVTGEAATNIDWKPTYKLKYNSYAF